MTTLVDLSPGSQQRKLIARAILIVLILLSILLGWRLRAQQLEAIEWRDRVTIWEDWVEQSAQATIFADRTGRIIEWSGGSTEVLGWTRDDMIGENISVIMPIYEREQHIRGMQIPTKVDAILNGYVYQLVCRVNKKNGQAIRVHIRLQGFHGTNGPIMMAQVLKTNQVLVPPSAPAPPL